MKFNMVGAFIRNAPFGTEIAFKKGLERLGHTVNAIDTSYPDQVWDHDADATIVFKWMEAYWEDLKKCKRNRNVYQPDDARFPHITEMLAMMRPYCDYALTFDKNAAQNITPRLGYLKSERLLLTADDELYRPLGLARDIDFCFVGSLSGVNGPHKSRNRMIDVLRSNGFIVWAGEVNDVHEIVRLYNRSKVALNHATDVGQAFGDGYGLQCRHFEVGLTQTYLLTNSCDEIGDVDTGVLWNCDTFYDEDSLVRLAEEALDCNEYREKEAKNFFEEIMQDHLPQHRAAGIVRFVESL